MSTRLILGFLTLPLFAAGSLKLLPPSATLTNSATPAQFQAALVHFINEVLPGLDGKAREPFRADAATPLFESGLIDSLAILDLIAFVERATGQPIPPRMVVMKHFRCVAAICDSFGPQPEATP